MRSGKASQRREGCSASGQSISLHGFCKRGGFRACGRDQRAFRSPFGNLRPHTCGRYCGLRDRKLLLQRYSWKKHAFFRRPELPGKGSLGTGGGFFHWELAPPAEEKLLSGFCYMDFPLERGSAGPGGRGDSDLPPMPPWTPYTPFKRPRDTPGPPCAERGTSPCISTDRGRIGHAIWFGSGPVTNRVPGRARTLPGTLAAARTATRYSCRNGTLLSLQG